MADVSISGLTALGGAPATNDLLVEVDVSDTTQAPTGTTKKMTVANLFTSPTMTTVTISSGGLTVASGIITANGGVSATSVSISPGNDLVLPGGGNGITNGTVRVIAIGSGATPTVTLTGTLGVTSDFAIATSKFTVAAATGNTVAAGSVTASDHIAGSANAFQWTSRSKITSPADGNILLQNAAASAFTQLQFGGTTSAFPSLKRVGTGLVAQLADNSASASFQCQYINTDTPAGGTGAGLWKLGLRVASAVSLVTTQYIEVDIGGTLYKLATVS